MIETNQGGFVIAVPIDVVRTREGDLDFARFDPSRSWQFGEFEFARAVLALRRARQPERFRRLMNLAHYQGFQDAPGQQWLEQLMSDSRLTTSEREAVLRAFDEALRRAR